MNPASPTPTPQRVSSRLAKKEQRKMTKQTIYFSLAGLALVLLFIFVILPGAVRLFFKLLDSNSTLEASDTIPPQPPVLTAPATATNSATLKLSGYGEAESKAVVVINGQQNAELSVGTDGSFNGEVTLNEGENQVALFGVDKAGNESNHTRTFTISLDTQAPTIKLEFPEDGQKVNGKKNQLITVKGLTEANAKVYVNGRMIVADSEGLFSSPFLLQEGENTITIKAEDQGGNSVEEVRKVEFRF